MSEKRPKPARWRVTALSGITCTSQRLAESLVGKGGCHRFDNRQRLPVRSPGIFDPPLYPPQVAYGSVGLPQLGRVGKLDGDIERSEQLRLGIVGASFNQKRLATEAASLDEILRARSLFGELEALVGIDRLMVNA